MFYLEQLYVFSELCAYFYFQEEYEYYLSSKEHSAQLSPHISGESEYSLIVTEGDLTTIIQSGCGLESYVCREEIVDSYMTVRGPSGTVLSILGRESESDSSSDMDKDLLTDTESIGSIASVGSTE